MRTFGLCASILAVSNIVAFSTPAFAQSTGAADTDKTPSTADAKPAEAVKPKSDATAPADDAVVNVHVESPVPVSLERRTAGGTTWENVCTTPCDVKTSPIAEYRVTGQDLNESKPFTIDGTKENVTLKVVPGSKARADAGLYILVGGVVLTIVGVGVMVLGADKNGAFKDDGESHNRHFNAMFFGGALVLAGVTAGLFGGGWLVGNRHSEVSGGVAKTLDEKPAPAGSPAAPAGGGVGADVKLSTSAREPTWNAPKLVGLPQIMSVPVFAGKF